MGELYFTELSLLVSHQIVEVELQLPGVVRIVPYEHGVAVGLDHFVDEPVLLLFGLVFGLQFVLPLLFFKVSYGESLVLGVAPLHHSQILSQGKALDRHLGGFLEEEEVIDAANGLGLQIKQNHLLFEQIEHSHFSLTEHAELVESVMEGHFPDDASLLVYVHNSLGLAWLSDFQIDDCIVVGYGELHYFAGGSSEV